MTARPWIVVVIVAAGIAALAWVFNHQHSALATLQRTLEQERLAHDGQIVSKDETVAGLREQIAKLSAKDPALAVALVEEQAAAPDAHAVHAAVLSTGPLEVDGEPEEETPPAPSATTPEPSKPVAVENAKPDALPKTIEAPPSLNSGSCVLTNHDKASVIVDQVVFETKSGNHLIVGTANVWRESPGLRAHLFGGKFQSDVSDSSGLAPPSAPRWGFGAQGVCFSIGCAAGPGVAFPPARFTLFGHAFEIDANANLLVGGLGAGAGAGAYARF